MCSKNIEYVPTIDTYVRYSNQYFKVIKVIFDIDNTLVPHGAPADARAIALFDR